MRIKQAVVLLTLLIIPVGFSARAQETGCEIDLSSAVTQVVQAQAALSSGDTELGLQYIADVRAALAAINTACAEAGITPGLVLENIFLAPNGTFVLNYPAGWVQGNFAPTAAGGAVFLGNSQNAAAALNVPVPQLRSGDQAMVVAIGTPELLGVEEENPSLEGVLESFAGRSLAQFTTTGDLQMDVLEEREVGRMDFSGESFEAALTGIQLSDTDLYVIVVLVSAPGELEPLRPVADAVALSVR